MEANEQDSFSSVGRREKISVVGMRSAGDKAAVWWSRVDKERIINTEDNKEVKNEKKNKIKIKRKEKRTLRMLLMLYSFSRKISKKS